jgi:hypothetical protein
MTRSEITFWVFVSLALALAFIGMAAIANPASATDWDWSMSGDSYHSHKQKPRKAYRRKRTPDVRYYAPPVVDERDEKFCLGPVRGVGKQWIGEEGALDAAKDDWMARVRYDLGESFLDMKNAEDFEKRCGRTSVGETLGQVFYRCEIVARPCKSTFSAGVAGK